jgi:hypothetical protein
LEQRVSRAGRDIGLRHKRPDGAHLFYGSHGSSPTLLGRELSEEALANLIQLVSELKASKQRGSIKSGVPGTTVRSFRTVPRDQENSCANGASGKLPDLPKGTAVNCPFHDDQRPSAFIVESEKGSAGIHCASCMQTYWIEGRPRQFYDFYWFEKLATAKAADLDARPPSGPEDAAPGALFWEAPHVPVQAEVIDSEFLPSFVIPCGVASVRSPRL